MPYLLDSTALIDAKRRWYGLDFCPGYWDWLSTAHGAGLVFSIERVEDEVRAGDDELVEWIDQLGGGFFLRPDTDVVRSLSEVSTWASSGEFKPSAVSTFLGIADSLLVAHAHAHGFTVVTQEVPRNQIANIKIPNACIAMGVKYVNTFEMLRNERARFVLPS